MYFTSFDFFSYMTLHPTDVVSSKTQGMRWKTGNGIHGTSLKVWMTLGNHCSVEI